MPRTLYRRYSLRTRLALGIGVIALPLVVVAVSGYLYFLTNLEGTRLIVEQVYDRVMPVNEAQRLLQRAEIAVNNQIIHRNGSVQPFEQAGAEIDRLLDELLDTIANEDSDRVAAAKAHWEQARRLSTPLLHERLTTAELQHAHAQFAYRMESVHSELRAVHDDVYSEIFEQVIAAVDNRERFTVLMRTGLIAALVIALVTGLLMMRAMFQPLRALKTGALRLGSGEMDYRIPVKRRDEIGDVAEAFNSMAAMLEGSQAELRNRAIRDGLTGLFNQRELTRRLNREFRRAERYRRDFAFIIIDLDHFKVVNDTYGHLVGDHALRRVAEILQGELRSVDTLGRHGGEEFAAILPETAEAAALATAERLRVSIERAAVNLKSGDSLRLTASVGVAVYPGDANSAKELFEEADDSLYAAKHAGRNRTFYRCKPVIA